MTLTETGATLGLRQAVMQHLGCAAGFTLQTTALCAGLGMMLSRWPQLHSALPAVALLSLAYLGWQMLRERGALAGGVGPVPFCEAAARQFLNPRAWLMSAITAMLCLPLALQPVLMAGHTGAI